MHDVTPPQEIGLDGQVEALHLYNDLIHCGYTEALALIKVVFLSIAGTLSSAEFCFIPDV